MRFLGAVKKGLKVGRTHDDSLSDPHHRLGIQQVHYGPPSLRLKASACTSFAQGPILVDQIGSRWQPHLRSEILWRSTARDLCSSEKAGLLLCRETEHKLTTMFKLPNYTTNMLDFRDMTQPWGRDQP